MISDRSAEMQEEMKSSTNVNIYKLDGYVLCITTTTKSCLWGLKIIRIRMHENYSIKVEIWASGVKECWGCCIFWEIVKVSIYSRLFPKVCILDWLHQHLLQTCGNIISWVPPRPAEAENLRWSPENYILESLPDVSDACESLRITALEKVENHCQHLVEFCICLTFFIFYLE